MQPWHAAREHIRSHLCKADGQPLPGSCLVQLGDLGHSKHASGSTACFNFAKQFLDGFGLPYTLVLGNHDMEGDEFETDSDNLQAWHRVWNQPHYWRADMGPCVVIGLSTTRYRSNAYSHHEVYIDDAQMAWFEAQVQALAAANRPVIVVTHAPPMGCGLKVVQEVHVKNRCAWLNHSDRPERFIQLAQRYPNIRLWLSGHFHLSHNYQDSIAVVGGCAFVQVGVIGPCGRDGFSHSRLITADGTRYKVWTFDHGAAGPPRLDLAHRWDDPAPPAILTPSDEILISDTSAGWLSSQVECRVGVAPGDVRVTRKRSQPARWFPIGPRTILALQGGLLVEYDMSTASPVGLVCKVPTGCEVVLRTADGGPPDPSGDGADVAVVELVDNMTGGSSKYPRNDKGGFFVLYQPNKWRLKQERIAAERAAAAAGAAAGGAGSDVPATDTTAVATGSERRSCATG